MTTQRAHAPSTALSRAVKRRAHHGTSGVAGLHAASSWSDAPASIQHVALHRPTPNHNDNERLWVEHNVGRARRDIQCDGVGFDPAQRPGKHLKLAPEGDSVSVGV